MNDNEINNVNDNASGHSMALKTEHFSFHGTGSEYFRIWIVNLLLTLATLGIYSAWAKVRRMKYLHENTEFIKGRFGYHGDPFKILIGRVLVVAVLAGFYGLAHFYPVVSPIGSFVWILLLPALLTLALLFRLRNTSYRDLRFAFRGTIAQGYRAMALPLTLALVGLGVVGLAIATMEDGTGGTAVLLVGLLMLLVYVVFPIVVMPLFHVQWQRFSHQNSYFGSVRFGFTATLWQYTKAYLHSFGVFMGLILILLVTVGLIAAWQFGSVQAGMNPTELMEKASAIGIVLVVVYALLFTIQPYMKALFFNLAWNNTQIAGQRFRSSLTKWGMVKLGISNLVLTVITLGFFRPFAVIRTQRYLLEHLHLDLEAKGIVLVNNLDQADPAAHAEGALDLLGDVDM